MTEEANRELAQLSPRPRREVKRVRRALSNGANVLGGAPLEGHEDVWRIRVGGLRVLYEVDRANREIRIIRVRPRPIAYEGYERPERGQG